MVRVNPFYSPASSLKVDRRTRDYRILQLVRGELTAHVGGEPTAVQARLIERAAILHLQLAVLDGQMQGRQITNELTDRYTRLHNVYTRTVRALGRPPRPVPPPPPKPASAPPPPAPRPQTLAEVLGRLT